MIGLSALAKGDRPLPWPHRGGSRLDPASPPESDPEPRDRDFARSRSVRQPDDSVEGTITRILIRHRQGADSALAEAIAAVYGDLRRIAGRHLAGERRSPTLDTESLIHEAYLRLASQERTEWRNRGHFFAVAARIMRRILVDRARRRHSAKRGGGEVRTTTLDGRALADASRGLDVLTLDDALSDLKRHDARLAQIVELRFFGGLTNPEVAAVQGVTSMTVIRRWRLARAWLQRYLKRHSPCPEPPAITARETP